MEINTLSDPTRIAQTIRVLARDAHLTLRHTPSPAALRALAQRVDLVTAELGEHRTGPVGIWLKNLAREVRSPGVHQAGASNRMCHCAWTERSNLSGAMIRAARFT